MERAIAPRWTLKAEYGFLSFDDEGITASASVFQSAPPEGPLSPTAAARTHVSQDIHQFKLGMNYRLGAGVGPMQDATLPLTEGPQGTEIAAGVRYVHGWGQFPKTSASQNLASPRSPRV